jgi:hypothetical protein
MFVLLSFILSWLTGMVSLLSKLQSGLLAAIFIYAGFLVFVLLFVHLIRNMARL